MPACDASAAHRAPVTGGESHACQPREGDTQACSRRDKCSSLEAPELAVQSAMCETVQADPRAVRVASRVLMHSCPFTAAHCPLHKRSSAQRTRHMSKAKNTVIPSDSPPPCPTQPLSSHGPLRASLWSPADEAGPPRRPNDRAAPPAEAAMQFLA
jgi:hypothetical protein